MVCWKINLFGASTLYGNNCDDRAMASMLHCNKNSKIDFLDNQWPTTGKRGPTHQLVANPILAATTISGIKYPANDKSTLSKYISEN